MSADTLTTCTTVRRSCRTKRRTKKSNLLGDVTPIPQQEIKDYKTPEIQVEDDLGLDLLEVCDIPKDMLFPGEYNVYLQDRLKSVSEENKQLTLLVKELEDELASKKDKVFEVEFNQNETGLHQTSSFSGPDSFRYADMVACRVMELTKQVCELTAALEEQQRRCSLAESKLLSFIGNKEELKPISAEDLARKDSELKVLNEKLHATNSKLFECRNKIQQLQQELKNAHKVLSCEVGDGVPLNELLASGGNSVNWRGRAQHIQILQQRVTELTDRLKKCCGQRLSENTPNLCGDGKNSVKERKATLEVAQQETRNVQQQLNDNMRKFDAARARIKVLESEINSCKSRIQALTEKGLRDEDLIHILQTQVSQLEGRLQQNKDEARCELRKTEKYYQQLQDDLRIEKQRSIQLLSTLEDKEKQIQKLENVLFDLKEKEINASNQQTQCTEQMIKLEEISAFSIGPTIMEDLPKERQSAQMVEMECKKLLELVATVNRRLNDARHECDTHKSALRMERQRVARLEAKLARQEMERCGSFSMTKRQMACNAKKVAAVAPPEVNSMTKEEVQDRLELLQEEVLTLKTRLECLEQEKEADLLAFSKFISSSFHETFPKERLELGSPPAKNCV